MKQVFILTESGGNYPDEIYEHIIGVYEDEKYAELKRDKLENTVSILDIESNVKWWVSKWDIIKGIKD